MCRSWIISKPCILAHKIYDICYSNWGGDTAQHWGGGDTAHTFLMMRTIGLGTPHNIERKSLAKLSCTGQTTVMKLIAKTT